MRASERKPPRMARVVDLRQVVIRTTGPGHSAPIAYPAHGCGGPLMVAGRVGARVDEPLYCGGCHRGIRAEDPGVLHLAHAAHDAEDRARLDVAELPPRVPPSLTETEARALFVVRNGPATASGLGRELWPARSRRGQVAGAAVLLGRLRRVGLVERHPESSSSITLWRQRVDL